MVSFEKWFGGAFLVLGGINEKQMEVMMLMVESMQELNKQISEEGSESKGTIKGVGVVRSGVPDLPALPSWNATNSALQLGDWLLLLDPIVGDLTGLLKAMPEGHREELVATKRLGVFGILTHLYVFCKVLVFFFLRGGLTESVFRDEFYFF